MSLVFLESLYPEEVDEAHGFLALGQMQGQGPLYNFFPFNRGNNTIVISLLNTATTTYNPVQKTIISYISCYPYILSLKF